MNLLKRLLLSIGILTASVTAYATPIYTQQNPSATQAGAFNVVGGTVTTKLSLPFLTPSSFVQTDAQGNLVTPSATATNYIQNRSGLQAGATAYPDFLYVGSSATIPNISATTGTFTGVSGSTISFSSATFSLANITGLSGSTVTYSSATFTKANISTLTVSGIVGTTTNDAGSVGNYGQWISSVDAQAIAMTGSQQLTDLASITLTAGDWDISANVRVSTVTAGIYGNVEVGIGTVAGNNATGMSAYDNMMDQVMATAISGISAIAVVIPPWRTSIAATTTYYLKTYITYASGTPTAQGRISARRMR